jgi:hypothetical protein
MSQHTPVAVTRQVDARLLLSETCEVVLPAQLHYDAADPFAVTTTFFLGDGFEVAWVLARELLVGGLHQQTGDGDVALRPSTGASGTEVELMLSVPERHARVTLPAEALAAFLRASHDLVAPGTESDYLDLDAMILQLLRTERGARSDVEE